MALQNYGDLKASIIEWMFDRPDLSPIAGDFIALCHAELNRTLRTRKQLTTVELTLDDNSTADLPDDYAQFREVVALTNPVRVLELLAPTAMDSRHPYQSAGCPTNFTIDGTTLTVRPSAQSKIRMEYWAKLPVMVEQDDCNWLMADHPGIYLYGSLKHACLYIGDKDRASVMASQQRSLISELEGDDTLAMYSRANATPSRRGP